MKIDTEMPSFEGATDWLNRTAEQALDVVTGYAAYFGTYSVNEKAQTVTHHREGALNLDVVDYVRRYEFDGNGRLILVPVERPGNRLVWERVK